MVMKKKDPFGAQATSDPFHSGNNPSWVPGDDSFEDNAHQHPWQPGYVQFEDGSWGRPYGSGGNGFTPGGGKDYGRNAGRPGYVMAEDGTWVPESFYKNSRDPYYRNQWAAAHGKPIEW